MVGGSPNVGREAFGANTYAYEPAIDINASGQIALGFMESDTLGGAVNAATKGFISTFVTARKPTDPAGSMENIVLVPKGTGTGTITSRIGDFSGMNVDPVNGTFWHTNEFGGGGPTDIAEIGFLPNGFELQNGVLTVCGDEDSVNENDTFKLERESADPTLLDVFVNNNTLVPNFTIAIASLSKVAHLRRRRQQHLDCEQLQWLDHPGRLAQSRTTASTGMPPMLAPICPPARMASTKRSCNSPPAPTRPR